MTDEQRVICKLKGMHPGAILFIGAWMNAKQCSFEHVMELTGWKV